MRTNPSRIGLLAIVAVAALSRPLAASGTTSLTLTSLPGDYVGGGTNRSFTAADGTFTATVGQRGGQDVDIQFTGTGSEWWMLEFMPASGPLVAGEYLNATRFSSATAGTPGLDVGGDGRGCNALSGRFVVLEAAYRTDGSVQSFAADFEQHCEGGPSALFGSIRYGSSFPAEPRLFVEPASADEGDASEGSLSFRVSMSTVWLLPVSVEYLTADGTGTANVDYTPASGKVTFAPGQFTANVTVPIIGNEAVQADRTLLLSLRNPAGGSIAFGEATGTIVDDDGTSFTLDSDLGDWLGGGIQQTFTRRDGDIRVFAPDVSPAGTAAQAYFSGSGWSWWSASFLAPSGSALVPGIYEGALRGAFSGASPGLEISGNGHGCNQVSGRFLVMESEFDANHVLKKLAVDFEQHCELAEPATFGSVRYYSSVPPFRRLGSRAGFFPVSPCRVLDTRLSGVPLRPGVPQTFPAAGRCGIPFTAKTLSVNVTAADATAPGELWLYAPSLQLPTDGVLHFTPGRVRANWAFLPLGIGDFTAFCDMPSAPSATAHVIVDVFGYWQ